MLLTRKPEADNQSSPGAENLCRDCALWGGNNIQTKKAQQEVLRKYGDFIPGSLPACRWREDSNG